MVNLLHDTALVCVCSVVSAERQCPVSPPRQFDRALKQCLLLGDVLVLFVFLKCGPFLKYFANKGSSSQGYGFSCGHVWI